jgi:hypothetical protein
MSRARDPKDGGQLGINRDTLRGWVKQARSMPTLDPDWHPRSLFEIWWIWAGVQRTSRRVSA